jgi:sulfatase maturation enzyme AslB (radical SAM superfamily)
MIEGTLDEAISGTLYGWAWDDSRPNDPVVVDLYDDDTQTLLHSVTAGLPRADLLQAGKGNGRHGFSLHLPVLSAKRELVVSARVTGADFVLAGSPFRIEIGDVPPDRAGRESRLKGRFCSVPFEKLVLQSDGAHLCCPSYLPVVVGDIKTQNLDEIWNSKMAVEVRRSIIDGDFRYCQDICPAISQGTLWMKDDVPPELYGPAAAARSAPLAWGPKQLALLYDRTCNLSCPSCRTSVLVATRQEREQFQGILERVIRPALGSLQVLEFGGGEVLASHHLRSVVASIDRQQTPDLRVAIMTNATLFDREAWDELRNIHGMVHLIYVSLDAASKEAFEELRRGGVWEPTLSNVEFISSLRRRGTIEEFGILFVVQTRNFREMRDFVRLGKRLGCDRILFHQLVNFGTYLEGEFERRNIVAPNHPRHLELLAELQDPIFDDPCVDLTNFRSLRADYLARCHGP